MRRSAQQFDPFDNAPLPSARNSFQHKVVMKVLKKTLLLSTLLILSIGSAVAQTDNAAPQAAQSAASAASSAASAASSADAAKKSAEAAAAKFDLPINITVGDRIKL